MSIKGFKSQQALQQKLKGYTEEQSVDQARYVTVQEMPGRRHALDVGIHGLYQITTVPLTVGLGSNIRTIKYVSHGASKNDVIRLSNGVQCSALSIPDADTIILSVELDVDPTGDTFTIWRHITPAYNSDGSLNVSVIPSPTTYARKSGGITSTVTVLEDLDAPAASKPMPVAIHSIDGAGITVNAGDLSVSTSHVNDSMSIGDGTTIVNATLNNELKTHDADVLTNLGLQADAVATTDTGSFSLISLIKKVNQSFTSLITKITDGTQKTQITDGAGTVNTRQLSSPIVNTDVGLVTNSIIHGVTTGGGGGYVDVKVTPAGALVTETTVVSSTLPTGAATEATLSALNAKVTTTVNGIKVDGSAVTQPVSGTVTANAGTGTFTVDASGFTVPVSGPLTDTQLRATAVPVSGTFYQATQPVSAASLPLPTGAATETTLSTLNGKIPSNLTVTSTRLLVDGSGVTQPVSLATVNASVGRSKVGQLFNDYTSTSVTTAAYTQLIASTAATVNKLEVFDSSGEVMILAVGAAASEVDQFYILPGGNGPVDLSIPPGSRISVKAKTNTASAGLLAINLYS